MYINIVQDIKPLILEAIEGLTEDKVAGDFISEDVNCVAILDSIGSNRNLETFGSTVFRPKFGILVRNETKEGARVWIDKIIKALHQKSHYIVDGKDYIMISLVGFVNYNAKDELGLRYALCEFSTMISEEES